MQAFPVVELRQYVLKPGQRDVLIELFEREFVESQEREGMAILGMFRAEDEPDRFVWLRGFPDPELRAASLSAFYYGPVWREHGNAANETMVSSDDVLVLRPTVDGSGFAVGGEQDHGRESGGGLVTMAILYFGAPPEDSEIARGIDELVAPAAARLGGRLLAHYVNDPSPNPFPQLPVREGESCAVWFLGFDDAGRLDELRRESQRIATDFASALGVPPSFEVKTLHPTVRSKVRGAG